MRFSTLGVSVHAEDVAAVRSFYVEVLGFAVALDIGWFTSLRHEGHDDLEVCVVHRDHALGPDLAGPVRGVVLAFLVDDVDAEHARLVDLGVPVDVAPRDEPWGQRRLLVRDPAGTGIELVQVTAPDPEWLAAHASSTAG
jgi:catechol 2,3-dioxygenase-like lactoylglutathione lyase family enzyme